MRNIYLIAYDISEDKARTRVFNKLKGYGTGVQFSLFRCSLTEVQRVQLRSELWGLINHATDRILVIDLGPSEGRGHQALEAWGKPLGDPAIEGEVLVV